MSLQTTVGGSDLESVRKRVKCSSLIISTRSGLLVVSLCRCCQQQAGQLFILHQSGGDMQESETMYEIQPESESQLLSSISFLNDVELVPMLKVGPNIFQSRERCDKT